MPASPPYSTLSLTVSGPVARITLARPEVHNAFNEHMIADITAACAAIASDSHVRVVVLAGEGRSFSAGADIDWMQRMAASSEEANRADADRMSGMLCALDQLPQPVVARVQGAALGGGTGLVSIADIAIATRSARLGTTEVKVGLLPAVIGPFVLRKIGLSQARAHFLLGDRFDAETALRLGLVHEVVESDEALDLRVEAVVTELLAGSPAAQAEAKQLLRTLSTLHDPAAQRSLTASTIARVRASAEGREGLASFTEKRPPSWVVPPTHGTV